MGDWIRLALDILLIACVGAGLVQATRLIRHLSTLRQGREDMERFVREFNATVARAETGMKELRYAARESGDDLEKLVDKAVMARDELQFLVESADQIAERLSHSATNAVQSGERQDAEVIPLQDRQESARSASQQATPHPGNDPARQTAPKTQPRAPAANAPTAQSNPRRASAATQSGTAPSTAALSTLAAKIADARMASKVSPAAASRAEQELLQALQNLR